MRICPALLATFIACAGLAPGALAQVRPEARPQPIHKPKPKPAQAPVTPDPPPTPVMEEVHYLSPEEAPRLGPAPRRYHPPEGFAGHTWGETRVKFDRLPDQALAVRA